MTTQEKSNKGLWIVLAYIIIVVIGFYYFTQSPRDTIEQHNNITNIQHIDALTATIDTSTHIAYIAEQNKYYKIISNNTFSKKIEITRREYENITN